MQADLRWNAHVDHMVKKGGMRLFLLRKLKAFRLPTEDLVTIYTSYVRPVCEFAVPAWHPGLTQAQRNQLEKIQRRALRTILGKSYTHYADACLLLGLETLELRRDHLCLAFARKLLQSHECRHWFPPRRGDISGRKTRSSSKPDSFRTTTERFKKSPMPYMAMLLNNVDSASSL
ncbi:Hypp1975 [Branchiostoma lanceolatum]|uniref:Hypp1975 protein n=1 Tax=Branchiostoma lanceolatum TaxID=7740 RepID=A0A8J9ZP02_BRALA|nr:Hypp1975 [Branchiostoma lanceolatum]